MARGDPLAVGEGAVIKKGLQKSGPGFSFREKREFQPVVTA